MGRKHESAYVQRRTSRRCASLPTCGVYDACPAERQAKQGHSTPSRDLVPTRSMPPRPVPALTYSPRTQNILRLSPHHTLSALTAIYTHTPCSGPRQIARRASRRLAGTPPDVTAPTNRDPSLHNEGDVKPYESAARLLDTEHVEVEGWDSAP